MFDALEPRSLGDILSTTIATYRRRFLPLLAIAAVAQLATLIVGFVSAGIFFGSISEEFQRVFDAGASQQELELATESFVIALLDNLALVIIGFLILFMTNLVITTLAFGTFAFCVTDYHVRGEMSLGRAFPFALNRLGAMLGAVILIGLLFLVISIIIVGISMALAYVFPLFLSVLGFVALAGVFTYAAVQWSLIFPAALLEGVGPLGALSRSWELVGGSWWRVLGILLVVNLIVFAIILILNLTLGLIPVVGMHIANILVAPIIPMVITLLYIDLRVRGKNYSLTEMAEELHLEFNPDAA